MSAAARSRMEDVAALAGVSVATVSRALRGSPLVSDATRDKVLNAAEELDFAVSRAASSLATGRVGRIAVLMGGRLQSWFNGSVLDGLYDGLRAAEQELAIYRVSAMAERERFFAELPVRRNADALVVVSFALTPDELDRLASIGMPLVYVNQRVEGAPSVSIDDVEATRLGIRHLVHLGHRWPVFVRMDNRMGFSYSALGRLDGYRVELTELGAPEEAIQVLRAAGPEDGDAVVSQLLSLPERPTAVMAESDELALHLIAAWRRLGLRVPEDLSVLGFDDQVFSETFGLS
ncbi:MAG TPA: LacI family DNA-binding transcriptional regulator, partial [Microlunatus sp.]|nr:LacI family DNA-binding transcriptional regulator [Microlunatus sp.]